MTAPRSETAPVAATANSPGLRLPLSFFIAGPVAFFLGKSAVGRIAVSPQTLGGRSTAVAGWVIGAVGTAAGAAIFLIWWVLVLIANFGPPPA